MAPIEIQGFVFRTQEEAAEHVRKLLRGIGAVKDVEAVYPSTFTFLYELLGRHPKASSKLLGFKTLSIQPVNAIKGAIVYGLLIRYEDGELDDISWKQCITAKASSVKLKVAGAYRQAIQYQIDRFRGAAHARTQELTCAHCSCSVGSSLHVDHIIPFATLVDSFKAESGLHEPASTVSDHLCLSRHRFLPCDNDYESAWACFHDQRAQLQITCADCNIRTLRALRNT